MNAVPRADYDLRLETIHKRFFYKIFDNVSRGLLESDKLVFALRLLQIRLGNICEEEFDLFLKGNQHFHDTASRTYLKGNIVGTQAKEILGLSQKELF